MIDGRCHPAPSRPLGADTVEKAIGVLVYISKVTPSPLLTMECYGKKNITWRSLDGRTGAATVRCCSCIPCLLKIANDWQFRCYLESTLHDEACCLTLTINEEHIADYPEGVTRRAVQLFLKRVRKAHPVRYFGCGEYGSLKGRPHYHVILFGWMPSDKRFFKFSPTGHPIYVSNELSSYWTDGFATIEDFSEESAFYCSKYLNKIKPPVEGKNAPFTFMSLKPSIGILALKESDFERGYIYHKGRKCVIPRSYYQSLKRQGIEFPELAEQRAEYVQSLDDDEIFLAELNSVRKKDILLDKLHFL